MSVEHPVAPPDMTEVEPGIWQVLVPPASSEWLRLLYEVSDRGGRVLRLAPGRETQVEGALNARRVFQAIQRSNAEGRVTDWPDAYGLAYVAGYTYAQWARHCFLGEVVGFDALPIDDALVFDPAWRRGLLRGFETQLQNEALGEQNLLPPVPSGSAQPPISWALQRALRRYLDKRREQIDQAGLLEILPLATLSRLRVWVGRLGRHLERLQWVLQGRRTSARCG